MNRANIAVGAFTLLVLAVLGWYLAFWLKEAQPLKDTIRIYVNYESVEGLKIGSPVTLQGRQVGRVAAISIVKDPAGRPVFLVTTDIEDDPRLRTWIRTDSGFTIVTDNLLGDRHIDISFGTQGEVLLHKATVRGTRSPGFGEILVTLENVAEGVGHVVASGDSDGSLRRGIADLATAARGLAEVLGQARAERLGQAGDDVARAAHDLSGLAADLKTWAADPATDPRRTLADLNTAATNLRVITEKVRKIVDGPRSLFDWGHKEDQAEEEGAGEGSTGR